MLSGKATVSMSWWGVWGRSRAYARRLADNVGENSTTPDETKYDKFSLQQVCAAKL